MILRVMTYNNELIPINFDTVPQKGSKIVLSDKHVFRVDDIIYRYVNGKQDLVDVYVEQWDEYRSAKLPPFSIETYPL